MMKMTSQRQQYSSQYPNLLMTTDYDQTRRSINQICSNPHRRHSKDNNYHPPSFQPKNIYYNSNHRNQQQQYFTRPPRRQQQQYYNSYDRIHQQQHQPIRPLMEIKDNGLSLHHDLNSAAATVDDDDKRSDSSYQTCKQREPKQRGQYRNRKAELDWDHAFDLDLIDLYTTHIDIDSRSLTSTISSSDQSCSSL